MNRRDNRERSGWVLAAVAFAVGAYYSWELRAPGYRIDWVHQQSGYYNYLGQAFAHGRLELPVEPSPQLLAAPNPWDPAVDDSLKMHDMALFRGRYYLYHGAGPAVLLFTPWLLITGHDLPERVALFLLCFGGFLFSCGALLRWLRLAGAKTGPLLLALMFVALGLCGSVPYLLSRVWVYEIAIAGGYFCVFGGIFFLSLGMGSSRSAYWLGASGLMFGLAVSCRPHLALAGGFALAGLGIYLARSRPVARALASREFLAFVSAFALVALAVAAYNYRRFGDPFEFGLRYLLAGPNQNRLRLAAENVPPGLYFWLASAPGFSAVFPWVRMVFRYPFDSPACAFPPGYFIEATVGAFYLAPFLPGALFLPRTPGLREVRVLFGTVAASAAVILLFLAATGFTTQRYEVDFLPALGLVALANFGIHISRSAGRRRMALLTVLAATVAFGAVANMALGLSGPYQEMLKNRPRSYLRIARWFSPVVRYRPLMNPAIDVAFTVDLAPRADDFREPLLTVGNDAYRYFLYAEQREGKLRLVSRAEASTLVHDVEAPAGAPAEIRATYAPDSGKLTATVNGLPVFDHPIGTLVTAPAEVTIGENRVDPGVTAARFTGRIRNVVKTVTGTKS